MSWNKIITIIALIIAAAMSRFIPHPPNFTPILAIAIFSGAKFENRYLSIFIPILGMIISDLFIGFHSLLPVIYALILFFVISGWSIRESFEWKKLLFFSIINPVLFFIVSNFFVWLTSGMYVLDVEGLRTCFLLAIPFFHYSLISSIFYSFVLFGAYELIDVKIFRSSSNKIFS